jgi:hypothetical protein
MSIKYEYAIHNAYVLSEQKDSVVYCFILKVKKKIVSMPYFCQIILWPAR